MTTAGDCHGDASSTAALVAAGVGRVVVGMRHPLPHFRGKALQVYVAAGRAVEVLGESRCQAGLEEQLATLQQCLKVNEVSCGAAWSVIRGWHGHGQKTGQPCFQVAAGHGQLCPLRLCGGLQ